MGISLATALIHVQVDRRQLWREIMEARRLILRGLSGLSININLNTADAEKALSRITRGNGSRGGMLMSGDLGGFMASSARIATGILGAQAALAVLKFPVTAVKDASEFERIMIRIKMLTRSSDGEMATLSNTARRLGETTKFGPVKVAEAMSVLSQQSNLTAAEIAKITPIVLNFAAAGKIGTEEAADRLLGISKAMHIPLEELKNVANVLARAEFSSLADVHELGEAFKFVGPAGRLAGQGIEDVAGALALLADAQMKGSIGGTGLSQIYMKLANPKNIKKLEGAMGGEKLDLEDPLTGKMRLLPDIIEQITKGLDKVGMSAKNRLGLMTDVFDIRAGRAFIVLMEEGAAALRKRTAAFKDASIDIDDMAKKDLESMGGQWDKLVGTIQSAALDAILPMSEHIQAMAKGFAELIKNITSSKEAIATFSGIGKAIGEMVASSQEFFALNGEWLTTVALLGTLEIGLLAAAAAVAVLSTAFIGLIFSPTGLLLSGFALIIAALINMSVEGDTFGSKMKTVFGTIIPAAIGDTVFAVTNLQKVLDEALFQMGLINASREQMDRVHEARGNGLPFRDDVNPEVAAARGKQIGGPAAAAAAVLAAAAQADEDKKTPGLADARMAGDADIAFAEKEAIRIAMIARTAVQQGSAKAEHLTELAVQARSRVEEAKKSKEIAVNRAKENAVVHGRVVDDGLTEEDREMLRRSQGDAELGDPSPLENNDAKMWEGKKGEKPFQSQFVGVEELHKTIQLGILNAKKDQMAKDELAAAKTTAEKTTEIAATIKNMGGRFTA